MLSKSYMQTEISDLVQDIEVNVHSATCGLKVGGLFTVGARWRLRPMVIGRGRGISVIRGYG